MRKLGDEIELYIFLSKEEEDKTKLLSLKYSIGADDLEICNTLTIKWEENDRTMQGVLVVLNACCRHKSHETVEEFKYKLKKQEPGDPMNIFITEMKSLEAKCTCT